jgi:Rps23 Pro-64 3,4-dihydroxylase Tpa1-like proline 4-hydroxylase
MGVRFATPALRGQLEAWTGVAPLSPRVDMFASRYEAGAFLAPHADAVRGRRLAYVLYLSSLRSGDGGHLNLLRGSRRDSTRVVKRLVPRFNHLVLFAVSTRSLHSVSRVSGPRARLALSGWFH